MSEIQPPETLTFHCNVCAEPNTADPLTLGREVSSCPGCGSTVRWRSVIHALSIGLFGRSLGIRDFPSRPDLTGVGLSDWPGYASRLPSRLGYRNTFYDEEPWLDIADPPTELEGTLDFLISSDVFEHVTPPVERAFENSLRLLKPGGLLVLTVPYSVGGDTEEHYANLHEYEIVELGGHSVLVNRTVEGQWEMFEDPVFHAGGGATLEMRMFSRESVLGNLEAAGFDDVTLCEEQCLEFGIVWPMPYGLPILGRRPHNGSTEPSSPARADTSQP